MQRAGTTARSSGEIYARSAALVWESVGRESVRTKEDSDEERCLALTTLLCSTLNASGLDTLSFVIFE